MTIRHYAVANLLSIYVGAGFARPNINTQLYFQLRNAQLL
jgi:hypothetical protein